MRVLGVAGAVSHEGRAEESDEGDSEGESEDEGEESESEVEEDGGEAGGGAQTGAIGLQRSHMSSRVDKRVPMSPLRRRHPELLTALAPPSLRAGSLNADGADGADGADDSEHVAAARPTARWWRPTDGGAPPPPPPHSLQRAPSSAAELVPFGANCDRNPFAAAVPGGGAGFEEYPF